MPLYCICSFWPVNPSDWINFAIYWYWSRYSLSGTWFMLSDDQKQRTSQRMPLEKIRMTLFLLFFDYLAKRACLPVSKTRTMFFSEQCTYAVYLHGKRQLVTFWSHHRNGMHWFATGCRMDSKVYLLHQSNQMIYEYIFKLCFLGN